MALAAGDMLVYDGSAWLNTGYAKAILGSTTSPLVTSANNGLLNVGDGGFAGGGTNFVGVSDGTYLAINGASAFAGNVVDFQIAGKRVFSITKSGQAAIVFRDAGTTNIPAPLVVQHTSTGIAATGFGAQMQFFLQEGSNPGVAYEACDIQAVSSTVTTGATGCEAFLSFLTKQAGNATVAEVFRLGGNTSAFFKGPLVGLGVPLRLSRIAISMPSDANQQLSSGQYQSPIIEMAGSTMLTAQRNIELPLTSGSLWIVYNNTAGGQSLQFIGSSGTGVVVANGKRAIIYANGTNIVRVTPDT